MPTPGPRHSSSTGSGPSPTRFASSKASSTALLSGFHSPGTFTSSTTASPILCRSPTPSLSSPRSSAGCGRSSGSYRRASPADSIPRCSRRKIGRSTSSLRSSGAPNSHPHHHSVTTPAITVTIKRKTRRARAIWSG